tara:strand:+ start:5326 stop:6867 length:1542 start_codon:yes stop_codon:yes gene_type:complete
MAKDISPELKAEIIEFAKANSPWQAWKKYQVRADTIKYWTDPDFKNKRKEAVKGSYHTSMDDPHFRAKRQSISKERRDSPEGKKYGIEYRAANKKKLDEYSRAHRQHNIDRYTEKAKKWAKQYRESGKLRERYSTDQNYKIQCLIREGVRRAIKTGSASKSYPSIEYLGCTVTELQEYLEAQFENKMTWDNHGRGKECWHVDHIRPLELLAKGEATVEELCHYTNLQPLWEKDNLSKQTAFNESDRLKLVFTEKELQGEAVIIKSREGTYNARCTQNKIILTYQPHFYDRERELFENENIRHNLIGNRQQYLNKDVITPIELLRGFGISGIHKGYSFFSPLWVKQFVVDHSPSVVYDPCGGWGHRLLGFGFSNIPYIYNDIWEKSCTGAVKIANKFNFDCTVHHNDCRSFTPDIDYDTIFTCPPYYNIEIYSEGAYESINEFERFLHDMLASAVKPSVNTIGIVMSDKFEDELIRSLPQSFELADKHIVGQKPGSHLGRSTSNQYIYIFKRKY